MRADQKSAKMTASYQWRFALLESMSVKAARKTLMKLTPVVNFINILWAASTDGLTVFFAILGSACLKALHKMLVKSTP